MALLKELWELLKWLIARKEMEELERRRYQSHQYRQWFAEFSEVKIVLENMESEIEGKESFLIWVLRDKLRELRDKRGR